MWSRRDQVQAYQFLRRRLVAAFVEGNPDSDERPGRRLALGGAGGAVVGVLALAVSGVLGITHRGSPSAWASGDKVVQERETGARFVVDKDGVLHPVLNYTSAALFLGKRPAVVAVGASDLRGHQRGLPVGIPNAPDSLPDPDALLSGPWTVCSQVRLDEAGVPRPALAVQAGIAPPAAAAPTSGALVVVDAATGDRFVVAGGRRYRVGSASVLALLGLAGARQVPVAGGWLNTLTQPADLVPLRVPRAGTAGPDVGGIRARVGRVFAVQGAPAGRRLFVLLPDGLSPLGDLAGLLVLAGSPDGVNPGGTPTPLTPAELTRAPQSSRPALGTGLPAVLPPAAPVPADQVSLCATVADPSAGRDADIRVLGATPAPAGIRAGSAPAGAGAAVAADTVAVPADRGALVTGSVPGSPAATTPFLLTDQGALFAIGTPTVAADLGFGGVAPVRVPAAILALLPRGPSLDVTAVQAPGPGPDVRALGVTAVDGTDAAGGVSGAGGSTARRPATARTRA